MTSSDVPSTPSGRQVVLSHGDQRVVVVEVGGGLRSYAVGEWEVLDGYGPHERCRSARGQPLIPWPNRLRDGTYRFDGVEHRLPLSERANHNAIHGLVRGVAWTVEDRSDARATMGYALRAQTGWPFALDLSIAYALDRDGLRVRTSVVNVGDGPAPAGAGMHPYLRVGDTVDAARLRAPGRRRIVADDRGIPTGETLAVDGTPYDFLAGRTIGGTRLDTGYVDLERGADGRARVELAGADGRSVSLWMDEGYPYLMLFTGDTVPEPARRRRGLAVEPMTCAPNALASGDGLTVLAPGETLSATWGLTPIR